MKPHRDIDRIDCRKLMLATPRQGRPSVAEFFQRLHLTMRVPRRQSSPRFAKYPRHEYRELFQFPLHNDQGLLQEGQFCLAPQQSLNCFQEPNNNWPKFALQFPEQHQLSKQHLHMQPTNDLLHIQSQRAPEYQSDATCCPSSRRGHFGL